MITIHQIQEINDSVRRLAAAGHGPHRLIMSCKVAAHPKREELLRRLAEFDQFSRILDPYGEHQCGKFSFEGMDFVFEICCNPADDIYDRTIPRSLLLSEVGEYILYKHTEAAA
jgi:hypothetical protein